MTANQISEQTMYMKLDRAYRNLHATCGHLRTPVVACKLRTGKNYLRSLAYRLMSVNMQKSAGHLRVACSQMTASVSQILKRDCKCHGDLHKRDVKCIVRCRPTVNREHSCNYHKCLMAVRYKTSPNNCSRTFSLSKVDIRIYFSPLYLQKLSIHFEAAQMVRPSCDKNNVGRSLLKLRIHDKWILHTQISVVGPKIQLER